MSAVVLSKIAYVVRHVYTSGPKPFTQYVTQLAVAKTHAPAAPVYSSTVALTTISFLTHPTVPRTGARAGARVSVKVLGLGPDVWRF